MKNFAFLALGIFLLSCQTQENRAIEVSTNPVTERYEPSVETILNKLKKPDEDHVLVVSHRGDWRYAPENSLQAVQRCIDLGVDIVELDFRLTKDNHLVAMHDESVDRTTNGKGLVEEMSLEQIKALRLRNACGVRHARQQVPTLEEVMLLAKDKIMVNLDKTESKWVREAYQVLKKTGTIDHAIFKGNDAVEVMRAKYGSLMDSIIYMPKLWSDQDHPEEFVAAFEKDLNPFAYEILFDSENTPSFHLIPELQAERNTFLAIALWDDLCAGRTDELALIEGPQAAWGWLVDSARANAIMTDRPEELLSYLRSRNLHE